MISSILIPTDFSPSSWNATQVGLELSRLNANAELSLLHIYPLASKYVEKGVFQVSDDILSKVKRQMNHLLDGLVAESSGQVKNVVLSGDIEDTMLEFIQKNNFDLIILGINSNGQNNELGSHTIRVIRESGVPVMIVPNNSSNGAIAS